jgi:hypothetical protein
LEHAARDAARNAMASARGMFDLPEGRSTMQPNAGDFKWISPAWTSW